MEINWRVHAGERWSDMEEELQLEDPPESGDDVGSLGNEGGEGAIVSLLEHHEPTATPVGGGRSTKTRCDALESRKRATSEDATHEQEVMQVRSPCHSEAGASLSPVPTMAERAGRSGEHDRLPIPLGHRVRMALRGEMLH